LTASFCRGSVAIAMNQARVIPAALLIMAGVCCACSPSEQAPTSAPSSPPTETTQPQAELAPPADRCGEPENPAAEVFELTGPDGSTLPAVVVGAGSTVAVLLHQTNNVAMCGWWPYANWLITAADVQVLMFDLCGFGRADCGSEPFAADQIGQVELAITHARDQGATRVVIVGASMGGSIALPAAVAVQADAVVDLSGPVIWRNLSAEQVAPRLTMPTLIAISPQDAADYAALQEILPAIPASETKLVVPEVGHGWDMLIDFDGDLTPLASTVRDWIVGQYE
jgi:Alpha/beta hydrolase family